MMGVFTGILLDDRGRAHSSSHVAHKLFKDTEAEGLAGKGLPHPGRGMH